MILAKNNLIKFILSIILFSCKIGDKETIVVPNNYKGYIIIIYNQKSGLTSIGNGKRVYLIPSNGIYKTQMKSNEGLKDLPEFYYDKITPGSKLKSYAEFNKIPPDIVVGFMGARGSANIDYEGKRTVEYSMYYVGTKEDIKLAIKKAENLNIIDLLNIAQ